MLLESMELVEFTTQKNHDRSRNVTERGYEVRRLGDQVFK